MKFFVTFLSAMFLLVGAVPEADAKRFGSGGFGKSYSSPFKSSPAKQPAKASPEQGKAAPGRGGMMGGMMGGLLAGGLFAYLLGSGAFEGLQIMDMLLIGLAVFVIFRLLKGMGPTKLADRRRRMLWVGIKAHLMLSTFKLSKPLTQAAQSILKSTL